MKKKWGKHNYQQCAPKNPAKIRAGMRQEQMNEQ